MSAWRLWIGIVLLIHGVGHILRVLALFDLEPEGWDARSWLLTDRIGDVPAKTISVVLWVVAVAGFVLAGLGLLELGVPEVWWKPLAASFAIVSLVTLTLFWNAFPVLFPSKIGAIAVNVAVLVGVLIADWPTEEMLAG